MSEFTFVMPVYIPNDMEDKYFYYLKAVNSIFDQSDPDWNLVIVDDNSTNCRLDKINKQIMARHKVGRVYLYKNNKNMGPGISRNIGIDIANQLGSEVVLFLDSDDISHKDRLKVTKEIFAGCNTDVVYSNFFVIDENDEKVKLENLSSSIRDIVNVLNDNPPAGNNIWKIIGTKTGYINLTSSTSVKINVALQTPFPNCRASEDAYAWMLYSANGAEFYYTDKIPSLYRIVHTDSGSSSRTAMGHNNFYKQLIDTNELAFLKCINISLDKLEINTFEACSLLRDFYLCLSKTVLGEGLTELGEMLVFKSSQVTEKMINNLIYKNKGNND